MNLRKALLLAVGALALAGLTVVSAVDDGAPQNCPKACPRTEPCKPCPPDCPPCCKFL